MTVTHRKARAAGVSYYLRSQDGRPISAASASELKSDAAWCVEGPTRLETMDRLNLCEGRWKCMEDKDRFKALAHGFDLNTSGLWIPLVRNPGSSTRVALHDFTLSAPKSVSVLWALSKPEEQTLIEEAQSVAVRSFVKLMSASSYSRQGSGGRLHSECAVVVALFAHNLSRRDDPQLHTHCNFLNVAVRSDGSTGSLETLGMMRNLGPAVTAYHEELAACMQRIGFVVRRLGGSFEIDGVPDEVCRAFSLRRRDALRFVQTQYTLNRTDRLMNELPPSRKLMKQAIMRTRPTKRLQVPNDLRSRWIRRAADLGFDSSSVDRLWRNGKDSLSANHSLTIFEESSEEDSHKDREKAWRNG